MNIGSPTRRMLLVAGFLLVAAQFVPWATTRFIALWLDFVPMPCAVGPLGSPDSNSSYLCLQLYRHPSIPVVLVRLIFLLGLAAACIPLIRWCLRPVRDLVPLIADVGPQNLGHRLRPGPGGDDLARLGRTIDEMMDRIAVGYEAQRRFAADASHELRTPLAVQRTLIEVSMAHTLSADQLELLTAQLLQTNERNERLIEGLLVLSESDRGLMSATPLRLDQITAAVVDAHRKRAAEAGLTVTTDLRPRLVLGEQVLLERLIGNLMQNAVKYNRDKGTIDVRVGHTPALTIINTGDDIPPEEVSALFEPFRRRAAARIDHSGGAGLGLAIARSITRAHDGTIAASSTGHDGLRVEVTFPQPQNP
ncbi:sensor histidine kinase [Actinoplanes sp. HUAS TT8]|uniref:sensor histidine kinase n=1 Tax=Actinoplanes sp. HUAS TT8 TaxID=3447453 RepID=UPI003F526D24